MKRFICFLLGHRWTRWEHEVFTAIITRRCRRCWKLHVSSSVSMHPNCRFVLEEELKNLEAGAARDRSDALAYALEAQAREEKK